MKDTQSEAVISTERNCGEYFSTYCAKDAGTERLVSALRSRVEMKMNGSVLASLSNGKARVSCSEKSRSADETFWREIVDELEDYLTRIPQLLSRHFGSSLYNEKTSCLFQVQWLTGRKADYWHQDYRWNTLWDVAIFLYVGDEPTPTDIACPEIQPTTLINADEYIRKADGQPQIAQLTASGLLTIYRPLVRTGDVVIVNNHRVWHRTSPSLASQLSSVMNLKRMMPS